MVFSHLPTSPTAYDHPAHVTGTLVEVAPNAIDGNSSLKVFDSKLYGGGGIQPNPLLEWNDVDDWDNAITGAPVGQQNIYSLAVFDSNLYAGMNANGELLYWDKVSAWVQACSQFGSETGIYSLVEYNGKIYGGSGPNGLLLEATGGAGLAWTQKAAYGSAQVIQSLIAYNGQIFGGTSTDAKLMKWDGVSAWVQAAPTYTTPLGVMTSLSALCYWKGWLCASGTKGPLLVWNGVDDWIVKDSSSTSGGIWDMIVFNNRLYGGGTKLFIYDEKFSNWREAATVPSAPETIRGLAVYNNKLYATDTDSYLYEFQPS